MLNMKGVLCGEAFARVLVAWQREAGRQNLPWQGTGDAYKVWLSEVMLQQTQVSTVLGYYARFLEAFPTVLQLAKAPESEVMRLWAGLGYYSRARNLHACAKQVVERFDGSFPKDPVLLESLPGIGRSTAGAIASLAYGVRAPILDGNVKRVFCRYYTVEGAPDQSSVVKQLWGIAHENVSMPEPGRYNQALMDLGALCCKPKNPDCGRCPLMSSCEALRRGMVGLLPTPKPKKVRPSLFFVALLLEDAAGRLALSVRQEKGVWRDLWVPPLHEVSADWGAEVSQRDALAALEVWTREDERVGQVPVEAVVSRWAALCAQPWLVHDLTHRKLHFKVLHVRLAHEDARFSRVTEVAVPRVVHKLMEVSLPQAAVPQQDAFDLG